MKKIEKIRLSGARMMSNPEMKKIQGGVDPQEYCCTVWNICVMWENDCPGDGLAYALNICNEVGWSPSNC